MTRANHIEALVGQACVEASRCMARAIVVAIDDSQSESRPFTQLQTIDLFQASLMAFDGLRDDLTSTFGTIYRLAAMADGDAS